VARTHLDARKAVIVSTDSASVVSTLGNAILNTTDQPFSETNPYHQSDPLYASYNAEEAKNAAQRYTATTGKPLQFTLTLFAGSNGLEIAQLLQAQWKQAGIEAQVSAIEQAEGIGDVIFGRTEHCSTRTSATPTRTGSTRSGTRRSPRPSDSCRSTSRT